MRCPTCGSIFVPSAACGGLFAAQLLGAAGAAQQMSGSPFGMFGAQMQMRPLVRLEVIYPDESTDTRERRRTAWHNGRYQGCA